MDALEYDGSSNCSTNPHLADVIDRALADPARRRWLQGGVGAAGLRAFGGTCVGVLGGCATAPARATRIGFASVPLSSADTVVVPRGYSARVIYAWGDPIDGVNPAFRFDGTNTAEDQARQAGMHHDGMAFFSLRDGGKPRNDRGLLCVNHEYVDPGLLFADGTASWSRDKTTKSLNAHGVSVVEVASDGGPWRVVPSRHARRITAQTPMRISGPAAGHALLRTAADPQGRLALGTLNNCANGRTPWGTYLTCEENFNIYFAYTPAQTPKDEVPAALRRYGVGMPSFDSSGNLRGHGGNAQWHRFEERFDLGRHPNEANRFGWVVEIDPFDAASVPVKRTALGRMKHECADIVIGKDGRVVAYTTDDERNEYLYKFVSSGRFEAANPSDSRHRELLDDGTLYVAQFAADGSGRWLALKHGENGLTAANGFADQGEVLVKTRQAADRAGATMTDRPEWITHHPQTNQVYVALTNNARRGSSPPSSNRADGTTTGSSARPPVDGANPRPDNVMGHILRWDEDGDPTALTFKWDIFVLAGNPKHAQENKRGNIQGDMFGSPDGLWFDPSGLLWIQTDVSTVTINRDDYAGMGNNQMLACDVITREVRRFLTGPSGCEITGMTMTPDRRTLFINIQHPGENAAEGPTDPTNPRRGSNWPDQRPDGRPRSATVVITRDDGGTIGT